MSDDFEWNDGHGGLFKNDKEGNPARPDYTGDGRIDGKNWRIAAWLKDGKNGKFMSLNFSEPREKQQAKKPEPAPVVEDFEDEIPF